jgi:hypothetical protein
MVLTLPIQNIEGYDALGAAVSEVADEARSSVDVCFPDDEIGWDPTQ